MYLGRDKGGLEVLDLDLKIKAISAKHLGDFFKQEGDDWRDLVYYFLKLKLITLGLLPTDNSTPAAWEMPIFYKKRIE